MLTKKPRTKKSIVIGSALLAMGLSMGSPVVKAAVNSDEKTLPAEVGSEEKQGANETKTEFYLRLIALYTRSAMISLDTWLAPDLSQTSDDLRKRFGTLSASTDNNQTTQDGLQQRLNQDMISKRLEFTYVPPYVNDYTFQTILTPKSPYQKMDPRSKTEKNLDLPYNYIRNTAGLNIYHPAPDKSWKKNVMATITYKNFYTTVSSIQSYDAYILSDLYANAANGNQLTQDQNNLMAQASSDTWFAQVLAENGMTVLRQILIFNSQVYVLLVQLLQTQKEMLAVNAMTNTLMILGNRFNESQLYYNATGATLP
ncbi:MAG TPA: hypothetical protein VLJ15_05485 [Gammaproteobacteria bacterium]|nr:hypothetical protein [Gammaproteobacteria bacterium]